MYIERKITKNLDGWLAGEDHPNIAIISGTVGSGKTTMVANFLRSPQLLKKRQVFTFTLDDVILRRDVASDSFYFVSYVQARSTGAKKSLCFVDEVQKSEAVFDAIKLAWDQGIDFIVSGSNPEYLETQASVRLQRRSIIIDMKPLSLPEILHHKGHLGPRFDLANNEDLFFSMLDGSFDHTAVLSYIKGLETAPIEKIMKICSNYWLRGGLPKAYLAKTLTQAFQHIQASVERGFAPILQDTMDIFDVITVELAQQTAHEFSYENFFQRIRSKNRDRVNLVISKLMAHGYLKAKRPYIPLGKTSYFVTYSFIDPGFIAYLTDTTKTTPEWEGSTIESYVHARLDQILSLRARKSTLCYFKPYTVRETDGKEEIRFKEGEIDFVVYFGALSSGRSMGIEVKRAIDVDFAGVSCLLQGIEQGDIKFGVVLYGGMPRIEWQRKIIFWPWWLI